MSNEEFTFSVKIRKEHSQDEWMESAKDILVNKMKTIDGRGMLEFGAYLARGTHTYIAYRYGLNQYGCIFVFDSWGHTLLGYLSNGVYTSKTFTLS